MQAERSDVISGMSVDQLADFMSGVTPGSPNDQMAHAEFMRRQTAMQREATDAAIQAAQASNEAVKYTRANAGYMLWSVIVLAAASVANLFISFFGMH
jgi:hypothetical protein